MKGIVLVVLLCYAVLSVYGQPEKKRVCYGVTAGTGIAMSKPASTPFLFQVSAQYPVWKRFSAGIGTGVSVYDKIALIPLFGDIRFRLTRPMKFTPYLNCAVGYSFAAAKDANGGFYLSPSAGVLWRARPKLGISFSVGYESQRLERLKGYHDDYFATRFKEVLNHNSLTVKAGILF